MSRFLQKIKLILWKTWIIRKRHILLTLFEIAIPIGLCIFALYILSISSREKYIPGIESDYENSEKQIHYYPINPFKPNDVVMTICYSPNTGIAKKLMEKYEQRFPGPQIESFANEQDMTRYIKNQTAVGLIIGIVFQENNEMPKNFKYTLRPLVNAIDSSLYSGFDRYSVNNNLYNNVQYGVDMVYLEMITELSLSEYKLVYQQIPHPDFINSDTLYILPVILFTCCILTYINVSKRILEEKNTGMKEMMKMMGIQSWMCWMSWYIYAKMVLIIITILTAVFLHFEISESFAPAMPKSNVFIIWFFLTLFYTTLLSLTFAVSTLLNKTAIGTTITFVVWAILFAMVTIFNNVEFLQRTFLQYLMQLNPVYSFISGCMTILLFEETEGIHSDNFWDKPSLYSQYSSVGSVLFTFIGQTVFYFALIWYIENIKPGTYGIKKSWYFPCLKSYWKRHKIRNYTSLLDENNERPEIEKVSKNMKVGIHIHDLNKSFGYNHVVKNLNLNIYQNEITCLLGHNGAGKTTTMNIITGMTAPSKGSVLINGYDLAKNIDSIRKSLGLCPQFDIYFDDLTVLEHLMFFAMLRGDTKKNSEKESKILLEQLKILDKKNVLVNKLSGGMKRKLSLAMAVVGNNSILILDEPTSGLDPEARREIWDFLLNMRGSRTILITTHYMDEADVLGDRIAIMHCGSLQCYGSTLFLKKLYGTGYILNVIISNLSKVENLTSLIRQHIPYATVKNISGNCVEYSLPTNDTQILAKLFAEVEKNKYKNSIDSFGVSITTMEDVFLRVGEIAHNADETSRDESSEEGSREASYDFVTVSSELVLMCQQIKGLVYKRFHYTVHRWISLILIFLYPILFTCFIIFTIVDRKEEDYLFDFKLQEYGNPRVLFSSTETDLKHIYSNIVEKQGGEPEFVSSVSEASLEIAMERVEEYKKRIVVAAEFNATSSGQTINCMYGASAVYGLALSTNLITNTLLQFYKDSSYSIDGSYRPIVRIKEDDLAVSSVPVDLLVKCFVYVLLPIGLSLMIALISQFVQEERNYGVKYLQIMTGITEILYWGVHLLFDMTIYIVGSIILVVLLCIFDSTFDAASTGLLILIFIVFGFGCFPIAYILTFKKSSIVSTMIVIQTIACYIGLLISIATIMLKEILDKEADKLSFVFLIQKILYIFPQFVISQCIVIFVRITDIRSSWAKKSYSQFCAESFNAISPCCADEHSQECEDYRSYFSGKTSLSVPLLALVIHFFVYSLILLLLESSLLKKCYYKVKDRIIKTSVPEADLSEDAKLEKIRIEKQLADGMTDVLIAENLRKWYGRKTYATRNINFGVKYQECFGLLGVNGAGKTTTFKTLVGQILPSSGKSYINEYSINENRRQYLKYIGYCPQSDALNFSLTTKQMLTTFAYFRGIPSEFINVEVEYWLQKCGIITYANKRCLNLSGGNKRKLAVAIALIGSPNVIMLDEPTAGIDPVARRNLWNVLNSIKNNRQSLVLTTHSMEESEALCDRVAIMVGGQFQCLGNIPILKAKHGKGFTLHIKIKSAIEINLSDLSALKDAVREHFKCYLKDEHIGLLHYHVAPVNTTISGIFATMEFLKKQHIIIEDYTVNDTTLEEIFLAFAQAQEGSSTASRKPLIV